MALIYIQKLQLIFLPSVICRRRDGIYSSQDTVTSLHCPVQNFKLEFKKKIRQNTLTHLSGSTLLLATYFSPLEKKNQTSYSIKKEGKNPILRNGAKVIIFLNAIFAHLLFVCPKFVFRIFPEKK